MESVPLAAQLCALGFENAGEFQIANDRLVVSLAEPWSSSKKSCLVYMWVACSSSGVPENVLYAGKAGGSLKVRMKQHANGFANSTRGKTHKTNAEPIMRSGRLSVWVRQAEVAEILGRRVSLCEAEERALIEIFNPPWNQIRHIIAK
jgi:hypothetical protein